jgi:hypothetical protein
LKTLQETLGLGIFITPKGAFVLRLSRKNKEEKYENDEKTERPAPK